MRKRLLLLLILLIIASLARGRPAIVAAQSDDTAVVQAVLFYSPSCPHCHDVINNLLIPMLDDYGNRLQILGVDTTQPDGALLYQAAIERYQIADSRRGVPTLIVNEVVLVGSMEIPEQFPDIVTEGLATGGIGWPDLPGLDQTLPAETPSETQAETSTENPDETSTENPDETSAPEATAAPVPTIAGPYEPTTDPVGFTLAGLILVGMVGALADATWRVRKVWPRLRRFNPNLTVQQARTWAIPVLALAGLGVAVYLAYVEINQVEAVCGPVGECNVVQSSPYAQLFGIPIAVLGLLNYIAIGLLWAGQRFGINKIAGLSGLGLLALTIFGTLFSIYLTLLELFVIHAVCLWCLGSAIITTLLMWLVVTPVTNGLQKRKLVFSH